MSEEAVTAHDDTEIKIPGTSDGSGGNVSDEDLSSMQDQFFAKESKKDASEVGKKKAPKKAKTSIENSAEEFSQAIKGESDEDESEDSEEGEPGEDFKAPSTEVDMSQFLASETEEDESAEEEEEDEGVEEESTDNKSTNIKNLRVSLKASKEEVKTLKQELETKGDTSALQGKIQKLETRVQELQPYELVFGLHNNPEFKERFIQGSASIVTEMQDIAVDYGIEPEVVETLLLASSRKDINEIVSEYFPEEEAKRDLKALKQRYDGLQKERRKAEKAPSDVLTQLHNKEQETKAERNSRRDTHYKDVVTSSWSKALSANKTLPEDQRIGELIEIAGMKDHNQKVVRPTLESAQNLTQMGLQHIEKMIRGEMVIDESFASWFAGVCQQASATQMIHATRQGLYQKYQDLQGDNTKKRKFSRPGLETPTRSTSRKGAKTKKDGKAVSADIFMDVMKETG